MEVNKPANLHSKKASMIAGLYLFFALSAGNAVGGLLQYGFILTSLFFLILRVNVFPTLVFILAVITSLIWGAVAVAAGETNGSFAVSFLKTIRPTIEGFAVGAVLFSFFRITTSRRLVLSFVWYAVFMAVSMLIMIILPDLRQVWLSNWYSDENYSEVFRRTLLFRGWGASKHHLFGLPLALGLTFIVICLGIRKSDTISTKMFFLFGAVCSLLVIIPNARIGLVPIIVLLLLMLSPLTRLRTLGLLSNVVVLIGCATFALLYFSSGDKILKIIGWLWEAAQMLFKNRNAYGPTTSSDLLSMLHFPKTINDWIFGKGHVCAVGSKCYSDIGWIRTLQYAGIIGTLSVISLCVVSIVKAKRIFRDDPEVHSKRLELNFLVVCLLTFIAAFTKGEVFSTNDFSRLLMMLVFLSYNFDTRSKMVRHA